jgi:hypothetical protein
MIVLTFLQQKRLQVWISRQNNKWAFPSAVVAMDKATNPNFEKLFRYTYEGVGSVVEWQAFPEEEVTTVATGLAQAPKALTLRLERKSYIQLQPVFNFRLFAGKDVHTTCISN